MSGWSSWVEPVLEADDKVSCSGEARTHKPLTDVKHSTTVGWILGNFAFFKINFFENFFQESKFPSMQRVKT